MKLKELVGNKEFYGIDFSQEDANYGTINTVLLGLGNQVYKISDDPDDGYRSFMDEDIEVLQNYTIQNTFPPMKVTIQWVKEKDSFTGIHILDAFSRQPVLILGTDHSDNYYPYAVSEYTPENLSYNRLLNQTMFK